MPELPEVETVRIGLSQFLPGKRVKDTAHNWDKSFPNAPKDVQAYLVGAKILSIKRRAKVLIIELDTKYSLIIHLKMTGQLVYRDKTHRFGAGHPTDSMIGALPDRTTRVVFDFTDGSQLFFNDQRKFGWVRLLPTAEVPNIDFFKKVGPDALDSGTSNMEFRNRLQRRKNSSIKAALLDQTVIAGIGNIYADESLWQAKIYPGMRVGDVPARKLNNLFTAIRDILRIAIKTGGSTDRNYVDAEGKKGSYLKFAKVFRREGQDCIRHPGTKIIKTKVAGRGTHICPKCQRPFIDM